jgi:MFS transporter, PPP family, 3-phenylpropionic acid transporter
MITDARSRTLLSLRSFYFLHFAGQGALFPFLPLLLVARGFDAADTAWIMTLFPITYLIVPPLWGSLADALRARVWLLRLACVGAGLSGLVLLWAGGFRAHLAAVGLYSFFRAPTISLGDAATYAALGGRRVDFSAVRVWGSIGFALFALVPGIVQGSRFQEATVIVVASLAMALAAVSTFALPTAAPQREPHVLAQAVRVLRRPAYLVAMIATAVYYAGHSVFDAYFSLHVSRLGHSDRFVGAAWSIGVVAEIVLMLLAPRFIHRVGSGVLLLGCAAAAVARWSLLSVLTAAAPILLAQTLHAVTFGLWYLSLVKFCQERAPEHLRASLQSFTSAFMGLGMVAGYLAGGHLLDRAGGFALYRAAAIAAFVALALYGLSLALQRAEAAASDATRAVETEGELP